MDTAFYDWCRARVNAGDFIEDERIADWQYLTPLSKDSTAVVIGAGRGTVALALARTCRRVVVLDADATRLAAVAARARSQQVSGIETRLLEQGGGLNGETFDVAACRGEDCERGSRGLTSALRFASAAVRPGGALSLTIENAWSFTRWVQPSAAGQATAWTLGRCRSELRSAGFTVTSVHAVLPSASAPPLFSVPLQPPGAFEFFLRDLSGLLDLASPEAKAGFSTLRRVASLGVRATVALGASGIAAQFVPAFGVMAARSSE